MADLIDRDYLIEKFEDTGQPAVSEMGKGYDLGIKAALRVVKSAPAVNRWIPVSESLPDGIQMVLITWVNHDPEDYYSHIKDKPFTGAAHYCNGKWWWESSCCEDYLAEYGRSDVDEMDDAIEVLAWMPMPDAYEPPEVTQDGQT